MSYVSDRLGDRLVYDADAHLMEREEDFAAYLEADVLKRMPEVAISEKDIELNDAIFPGWRYTDYSETTSDERLRRAETNLMQDKCYRALGAADPSERVHALDMLGVEKQMIFATAVPEIFDSKYVSSQAPADPKLLYGGAQGANRYMADYCKGSDRLISSAYVPLDDPELTMKTLDEALKLGCNSILLTHGVPEERSWSHPDYEPVWARIAEANVPFLLHVGGGEMTLKFPKAVYNNGRPEFNVIGDGSWQIADAIGWTWCVELMLTQLIFDGVFERHPGLRCGVCEMRAQWVPSFMNHLDWVQSQLVHPNPHYDDAYKLPMRASDYIRRQVRFTPDPVGGDPLAAMINEVEGGEYLYCFNTDYPHPEGGVDPIANFEKELSKLEHRSDIDKIRDQFYSGNFADLMGF